MFPTGGLCPDASPQLPVQIGFSDECEYPRWTWPSSSTSARLTSPVFWATAEDAALSAVISDTSSSTVHFRLSPAYALYAAGRFALQQQVQPGSQVEGWSHRVTRITGKMVAMMRKVLQARKRQIHRIMRRLELFSGSFPPCTVCIFAWQGQQAIAGALAFWMANSSELLHFLKRDKDLSPLTRRSQLDLTHLVHSAYR